MHRPPSLPTSSTFPLAYPFKTMVLIFVSPRTEHHNAMKQMGEDVCGGVRSEREANKRNMFLQHASYTLRKSNTTSGTTSSISKPYRTCNWRLSLSELKVEEFGEICFCPCR